MSQADINNSITGFEGAGSTISNFTSLQGVWTINDGVAVASDRKYGALLVHDTARMSGPFSLSVTITPLQQGSWDGFALGLRRDATGTGWEFLECRVRAGNMGGKTDTEAGTAATDLAWHRVNVNTKVDKDVPMDSSLSANSGLDRTRSIAVTPSPDAERGGRSHCVRRSALRRATQWSQLGGRWQEVLGDWNISNGVTKATILDKSTTSAMLLYTQPAADPANAFISADATLAMDLWTGIVFNTRVVSTPTLSDNKDNPYYQIIPDNYFSFQIHKNAWRVIYHKLSDGAPVDQSGGALSLPAGNTYRLRVQFETSTLANVSINLRCLLRLRIPTIVPARRIRKRLRTLRSRCELGCVCRQMPSTFNSVPSRRSKTRHNTDCLVQHTFFRRRVRVATHGAISGNRSARRRHRHIRARAVAAIHRAPIAIRMLGSPPIFTLPPPLIGFTSPPTAPDFPPARFVDCAARHHTLIERVRCLAIEAHVRRDACRTRQVCYDRIGQRKRGSSHRRLAHVRHRTYRVEAATLTRCEKCFAFCGYPSGLHRPEIKRSTT
jgi:hypothetical protein